MGAYDIRYKSIIPNNTKAIAWIGIDVEGKVEVEPSPVVAWALTHGPSVADDVEVIALFPYEMFGECAFPQDLTPECQVYYGDALVSKYDLLNHMGDGLLFLGIGYGECRGKDYWQKIAERRFSERLRTSDREKASK